MIIVRINYIFWGITDISAERIKFLNKRDKCFCGFNVNYDSFESITIETITVESVTKQGIQFKVIYCCKWEQIFTAVVAMPYLIWKPYVLGINII